MLTKAIANTDDHVILQADADEPIGRRDETSVELII
jgi:hypothetical protein